MTQDSNQIEKRLQELGLGEGWTWSKGSWWLDAPQMDMRTTTERMIACDARFVCITASERPDKEIRLDYQWDLDGQLLSFVTATHAGKAPSIVDLTPAADWVERETYEYFAVEFTGRTAMEPLMTRAGDPVGINLHKEVAK